MKISYAVPALALILSSSCTHTTKVLPHYSQEALPLKVSYVPERTPSAEDVDWFAAADKQVQNATCRLKLPTTTAEIQKYYQNLPKSPLHESGSYEVFGIQFENERPELVLAFSKLFIPADRHAPPQSEQAPKNLKEKFRFDSKCKNVLCASQTIFGKDVGPQMIFLMEKFDINTSAYSHGNASTFRSDEIADMIKALELVDTSILPFKRGQKLTKFSRGYTLEMYGPGVLANASMEFFDGWSTQKSFRRQYTTFHEFAHTFANNHLQDYDSAQAWLKLSGWVEKEKGSGEFEVAKSESKKPHNFVSIYGKSNPFEDFAESVSAYRLNPALLKKKSQAKYDYIKYYVFDGLEYDSQKNCGRNPTVKNYQAQIDSNKFPFSPEEKETIIKSCRLDFYNLAFANGYQSTFKSCVDLEATDIWMKKVSDKNNEVVPKTIYDSEFGLSNLKFNELNIEIANTLTSESADWLLSQLKSKSYKFHSNMDLDSYCDIWGDVKSSFFPSNYEETKWRKNYYAPAKAQYTTRANSGKLIDMCKLLNRVQAPSSQSAPSKISSFIQTVSMITTGDILKDRNLTKDDVFDIIAEKTIPKK